MQYSNSVFNRHHLLWRERSNEYGNETPAHVRSRTKAIPIVFGIVQKDSHNALISHAGNKGSEVNCR